MLFVIVFHYGYFTAGWIGVQIFFVLSGFLITSILLAERQRPVPFFKRFYWRRSLRIFPFYFAYLLALTAVFLISGHPEAFASRWAYLYTYTYNYALLRVPLEQSPAFTHFWSLAVEEQFYLVWPLAVYYLSRRSLSVVVGAALVVSPLVRLFSVIAGAALAPGHPEPGLFAYATLPAQFDALATGAGLALIDHRRLAHPARLLGVMSVVVLGLGLMNVLAAAAPGDGATTRAALSALLDSGTSFGYAPFGTARFQHVWSYSAINLWSAMLVINILRAGALHTWLGHRWLVYTGQISYGLYVFHYPLMALLKTAIYIRPMSLRGAVVFVVYLPALFVIAGLSFRYFESRFLAWKDARYSARPGERAVSVSG